MRVVRARWSFCLEVVDRHQLEGSNTLGNTHDCGVNGRIWEQAPLLLVPVNEVSGRTWQSQRLWRNASPRMAMIIYLESHMATRVFRRLRTRMERQGTRPEQSGRIR